MQFLNHVEKLMLWLAFIVAVILIGHELKLHLPDLEAWVATLGMYAPVGFILLFVVVAPLFVSIDALCFAAGVLFPLVTGELAVVVATYLSATIIFFLGRDLVSERVEKFISGHEKFSQLDRLLSADNSFKLMFLLRLTPLPFAMLSYALSITKVKFWPYLVATSGILLYNGTLVYLGYATKHLTGFAKDTSQTSLVSHGMLVGGVLAIIGLIICITKVASNMLKELDTQKA